VSRLRRDFLDDGRGVSVVSASSLPRRRRLALFVPSCSLFFLLFREGVLSATGDSVDMIACYDDLLPPKRDQTISPSLSDVLR